MLFQLFNIDQKNETEVYLYGKEENSNGRIVTIRVINIISPVFFLPSTGKEELFMNDLKNFTEDIDEIRKVTKTNIFINSLPKKLELLQITFRKGVDFKNFESEYCEFIQKEFQNPVENLIVSKKIMGPGIIKLENIKKDVVSYENIIFKEHSKFPELKIASIAAEYSSGMIKKFVYFNDSNKIFYKAVLNNTTQDKQDGTYKVFSDPKLLNSFLNEIIRKDGADVILVHNFHLKNRLFIREKIFCDIFQFASGTIKGRDFSIQEICNTYKIHKENGLEGDTQGLVAIFKAMNALNLAKEMAEISGYILNKCLQNCRAERIEYTLLHELYSKDYIFPVNKLKEDIKYAGGLVLEPKQGFYEDIILLLDFNSLYPSIIQEFNVCFSTIGSCGFSLTKDNSENIAKDIKILGAIKQQNEEVFLPKILRNLVKRRRAVKDMIKSTKSAEEKSVLDIRQQALKLTANSIYGCLGFSGSRFCNYEMAAFITAKGREILGETKIIAENMNMRVIYGDTDSIMIHTNFKGCLEHYEQALSSASALVEKINSKYENIEIELEKAFKKLLLYTKKKYAALVFDKYGSTIETKGIDLVRRDFCKASTDLSRTVLNIILDDKESKEEKKYVSNNTVETVEHIYQACINFYQTLFKRPVEDFVITSVLNREVSQYASGSNLPHVNLALRLNAEKGILFKQDDVIPYVIGKGEGNISLRSFHPDEDVNLDFGFYIKHQILPPLYRLISLISCIHPDKINLIFNIKDYSGSRVLSKNLTFLTPCCENVQEPAKQCSKCNTAISDSFYIQKTISLINESLKKLYHTVPSCEECGLKYYNHLTRCIRCNNDLTCEYKNAEFNNLLDAIDISFKNNEISEICQILAVYSSISTYRVVDFTKYFRKDIQRYKID